jgi:hypothetical protein
MLGTQLLFAPQLVSDVPEHCDRRLKLKIAALEMLDPISPLVELDLKGLVRFHSAILPG